MELFIPYIFESVHLVRDFPKNLHDKQLDYNHIMLDNLTNIVKLSFITQRSINHLDLSVGEITGNLWESTCVHVFPNTRKSFIITEEECKKIMLPKRKLLYTLHLDLPRKLEMRLRLVCFEEIKLKDSYDDDSFHLRDIFLGEGIYRDILRELLEESIERIKTAALIGRYLKIIKENFGDLESFASKYLILRILYEECNDSQIVKVVLTMFDFKHWIFYSNVCSPEMLDFFCHHARKCGYNVWGKYACEDLINGCIMHEKYSFVPVLLKYIYAPMFMEEDYERMIKNGGYPVFMINTMDKGQPVREGWMTKERSLLALQTFYLYDLPSYKGDEALRLLWRAIPDSFLTLSEWMSAFEMHLGDYNPQDVDMFYSHIVEEDTSIRKPRSLKQYCRVIIRKSLYDCWQLPNGIEELDLDPKSKAFLRLEN